MATCHKCKVYLHDTIPMTIKKELALYDDYRGKHIHKILPEFTDWILKVFATIDYNAFCECWANGRMFTRRGKNKDEDEFLLQTAIYYQMKKHSKLLQEDVKHIHLLLAESGVLRTKRGTLFDEIPEKYLAYVLPTLYLCVHTVHDDHTHPERHGKTQEEKNIKKLNEEEEDLYW